jgi:hypothetical protein
MNSLPDLILRGGLVLEALGVLGLGLLGLASLRLALRHRSWGGHLMAAGALALLLGRLFVMLAPHFLTPPVLAELGRSVIAFQAFLPVALLTLGLAGVVWGLWGHERWMREGR